MSALYETGSAAAIHAQDNSQHNVDIGTAAASTMAAQRYSNYMHQPEADDLNMAVSSPIDDAAAPLRTRSVHGSGPPPTNMVDVVPIIRRGNVSHSAPLHAPPSLGPPPHTMGSWPRQPAYNTPWMYQGPGMAQGSGMAQQFRPPPPLPPLQQPHPPQLPTYVGGQDGSNEQRHHADDHGAYSVLPSRAPQLHSKEPVPMTENSSRPAHLGPDSSISFPHQTAWSQPLRREAIPRPPASEPLHYSIDTTQLPPQGVHSTERLRQGPMHHSQAVMERSHRTHEGEQDDAPLQRMAAAAAAAAASLEELPGVRDPSQHESAGSQSPAAIKSAALVAAAARNAFTKAATATRVATQRLVRARAAFNEAEEQAASAPQGASIAAACTLEEALIDEEVAAEQLLHGASAAETAAEMAWRSARQRLHAIKSWGERYISQAGTLKGESIAAGSEADGTAVALSEAAAKHLDAVLHAAAKTDEETPAGSAGKDLYLSNDTRQNKRQMLQKSKLRQAGSVKITRATEAASSKPSLSDQPLEPPALKGALDANDSSGGERVILKRRGRQVDPNSARQKRLRAAAVAAETAAAAQAAGINSDSDSDSGSRHGGPSPSASRHPSRSPSASASASGRGATPRTRHTRLNSTGVFKGTAVVGGRGRGRGGRGRGRARSGRGRGRGRSGGRGSGRGRGWGRGRGGRGKRPAEAQADTDPGSESVPEDEDTAEAEEPQSTEQQQLPQQVRSPSLAMTLAQEQKLLASHSETDYRGSAPPALMQSARELTEGVSNSQGARSHGHPLVADGISLRDPSRQRKRKAGPEPIHRQSQVSSG